MTSLSKVCLHWTAGSNKPCDTDLKAYHFLIDSNGRIYPGTHKPEDNLNCKDGNYAAHCGGGERLGVGITSQAQRHLAEPALEAVLRVLPI